MNWSFSLDRLMDNILRGTQLEEDRWRAKIWDADIEAQVKGVLELNGDCEGGLADHTDFANRLVCRSNATAYFQFFREEMSSRATILYPVKADTIFNLINGHSMRRSIKLATVLSHRFDTETEQKARVKGILLTILISCEEVRTVIGGYSKLLLVINETVDAIFNECKTISTANSERKGNWNVNFSHEKVGGFFERGVRASMFATLKIILRVFNKNLHLMAGGKYFWTERGATSMYAHQGTKYLDQVQVGNVADFLDEDDVQDLKTKINAIKEAGDLNNGAYITKYRWTKQGIDVGKAVPGTEVMDEVTEANVKPSLLKSHLNISAVLRELVNTGNQVKQQYVVPLNQVPVQGFKGRTLSKPVAAVAAIADEKGGAEYTELDSWELVNSGDAGASTIYDKKRGTFHVDILRQEIGEEHLSKQINQSLDRELETFDGVQTWQEDMFANIFWYITVPLWGPGFTAWKCWEDFTVTLRRRSRYNHQPYWRSNKLSYCYQALCAYAPPLFLCVWCLGLYFVFLGLVAYLMVFRTSYDDISGATGFGPVFYLYVITVLTSSIHETQSCLTEQALEAQISLFIENYIETQDNYSGATKQKSVANVFEEFLTQTRRKYRDNREGPENDEVLVDEPLQLQKRKSSVYMPTTALATQHRCGKFSWKKFVKWLVRGVTILLCFGRYLILVCMPESLPKNSSLPNMITLANVFAIPAFYTILFMVFYQRTRKMKEWLFQSEAFPYLTSRASGICRGLKFHFKLDRPRHIKAYMLLRRMLFRHITKFPEGGLPVRIEAFIWTLVVVLLIVLVSVILLVFFYHPRGDELNWEELLVGGYDSFLFIVMALQVIRYSASINEVLNRQCAILLRIHRFELAELLYKKILSSPEGEGKHLGDEKEIVKESKAKASEVSASLSSSLSSATSSLSHNQASLVVTEMLDTILERMQAEQDEGLYIRFATVPITDGLLIPISIAAVSSAFSVGWGIFKSHLEDHIYDRAT
eukprot:jgi/Bigna1/87401/estExt_fgenesh1_pg.C_200025